MRLVERPGLFFDRAWITLTLKFCLPSQTQKPGQVVAGPDKRTARVGD